MAKRQASRSAKKATPAAEARRPSQIKVRALQMGYYDLKRRRTGDVFVVKADEFSARWMERVSAETPERVTTGQEQLRREHDEILKSRAPANLEDEPTGEQDPLHGK